MMQLLKQLQRQTVQHFVVYEIEICVLRLSCNINHKDTVVFHVAYLALAIQILQSILLVCVCVCVFI